MRVDAVTLHVSRSVDRNEFWWHGYIKHTPFQCTTYRLPVSILDEWEGRNDNAELREELAKLVAQFEAQGGRGIELADRIDAIREELGEGEF